MTMMQFGILDPMTVTAARAARTPSETKDLVRRLNEGVRKRREEQAAADERHRKEADEQIALTKRLSEGGPARRAAAATASTTPTGNVFDFYRAREAARQATLAAVNRGRR